MYRVKYSITEEVNTTYEAVLSELPEGVTTKKELEDYLVENDVCPACIDSMVDLTVLNRDEQESYLGSLDIINIEKID